MSNSLIKRLHECPQCRGKGYSIRVRVVQDITGSLIIGVAMGVGYHPVMTMETTQEICPTCKGMKFIKPEGE